MRLDPKAANAQTRTSWNENAAYWDARTGGDGNAFVETLIWPATQRLLDPQPGQHFLDVACGTGLYSRKLAALGAQVAAFDFAAEMTREHSIPFLFMTYFNIIYRYGQEAFFKEAKSIGIKGLIVPDLPPEEGASYLELAKEHDIAPIQVFAPTSTDERMRELAAAAEGFIYCVARRGVTGEKTSFGSDFDDYLRRCRAATNLPLAVGFGIQDREDVAALAGKADIAVIGTRTIRLVEEEGPGAVDSFVASLR